MTDSLYLPDDPPFLSDPAKQSSATVIWSAPDGRPPLTQPPDLVNPRYHLTKQIEQGGMGTIYQARDTTLAREVAVKVMRLTESSIQDAKIAYANEARIMGYLSHPGIPPIYDCGITQDGRPYHVMKLVHGRTLLAMLKGRRETPSHLLSIFADICHTMAFAHSRNVIHLDLKPANIMVGSYGEVYVMDWGLARFEGAPPTDGSEWVLARKQRADQCAIAGTPEYMSPEQARGESMDARADVFGLGALLCEILIGQAPYIGTSVQQVHRQALKASMGQALQELEVCDTDRTLVQLTKRCLAANRRDRPKDAIEVAQAVSAYQETALQRAENDMERFFELSLDLFCIADFEGFFRRINSNFSKLLGYTDQELRARPFMDFVHPDDVDETTARVSALSEGQPVVRFSNRYRTAQGSYVTLEWTSKAIEDEQIIFAVARHIR